MSTYTIATRIQPEMTVEEKISRLPDLFADARGVGKTALPRVLQRLAADASAAPPPQNPGGVGSRLGKVSGLTIIVRFAPGSTDRAGHPRKDVRVDVRWNQQRARR